MRVLVVEDDADIREGLTELLQEHSFEVSSAPEGNAALSLLRASLPDVILLDALMLGMDGREFLDEQRRRPDIAAIPVVVMTGLPPQLVSGLRAAAVLAKPFSLDELLGAIRIALTAERNTAVAVAAVSAAVAGPSAA